MLILRTHDADLTTQKEKAHTLTKSFFRNHLMSTKLCGQDTEKIVYGALNYFVDNNIEVTH